MRTRSCQVRVNLLMAALISSYLLGSVVYADTQPLRFCVTGYNAPPSPTSPPVAAPATLDQLMLRVIEAQPTWFVWVGEGDSSDAKLSMTEQKSAGTGKSLYSFTVTGKKDRSVKLVFDSVASAEPQILILFQGMYIAKNAAHISSASTKADLVRSDGLGDTLKAKSSPEDTKHDRIGFTIKAPEDGYAYLINYRADGSLDWFWPKEGQKNFVPANTTIEVPGKDENGVPKLYEVTKPLGKESVRLIFVSVPITQSLKLMDILPRTRSGEDDSAQLLEASRKSRSGTIRFTTDELSYTVVETK